MLQERRIRSQLTGGRPAALGGSLIRWQPILPVLDESWPVRYRFESLGALQRHLRLGEGFLLPDAALPGGPGARVIVEVAVPETSDRPLLHGRVRERVHDGIWLDLPSARPAARWEPDPNGPRRRHRRLACELFVEVHPRGGEPWLCRALDLSDRGLRIATGLETGIRGDEVAATLISSNDHLAPAGLRGSGASAAASGPNASNFVGSSTGAPERSASSRSTATPRACRLPREGSATAPAWGYALHRIRWDSGGRVQSRATSRSPCFRSASAA